MSPISTFSKSSWRQNINSVCSFTNLLSLFSAQELIKPPAEEEQTEMESFDGRLKPSIILLDKEVIREVEDANHTQVPSSFRRVKLVRSNIEDYAPMI